MSLLSWVSAGKWLDMDDFVDFFPFWWDGIIRRNMVFWVLTGKKRKRIAPWLSKKSIWLNELGHVILPLDINNLQDPNLRQGYSEIMIKGDKVGSLHNSVSAQTKTRSLCQPQNIKCCLTHLKCVTATFLSITALSFFLSPPPHQ